MGYVFYTIAGIALYFISDWILVRIEEAYGGRFKYRSVVFFFIIATLALITSQLISPPN